MQGAGVALVGREPTLGLLRAALHAARTGRGRAVLVAGEPGIGKTSLVAALADEAVAAGGVALWGHCWEGSAAPPYWPFAQVLRAGLRGRTLPDALTPARRLLPAAPGRQAGRSRHQTRRSASRCSTR